MTKYRIMKDGNGRFYNEKRIRKFPEVWEKIHYSDMRFATEAEAMEDILKLKNEVVKEIEIED